MKVHIHKDEDVIRTVLLEECDFTEAESLWVAYQTNKEPYLELHTVLSLKSYTSFK